MMKCNTLFDEFRKFEGQPVKIFTDDGKVHCGIDMEAFETAVRILDDCGRTLFIEFSHIDAVVEPQMRLRRCCRDECRCRRDDDDDRDDRDDDRDDRDRECDRDHDRDRDCDRDERRERDFDRH